MLFIVVFLFSSAFWDFKGINNNIALLETAVQQNFIKTYYTLLSPTPHVYLGEKVRQRVNREKQPHQA